MLAQFRNRRFYIVLLIDIEIFIAAFVGAYLLRFDFILTPFYRSQILHLMPFLLPGKVFLFFVFGLYRGMWRYSSLDDLWRLGQASLLSMLFYIAATSVGYGFIRIPRSVFFLDCILTVLMSGGLRMAIRLYFQIASGSGISWPFGFPSSKNFAEGKSILIMGAGGAGEKMLREIFDNPNMNYRVIGFLDDDSRLHGNTVDGLTVFPPELAM